jgi:hypothetical protein
MMQFYFLGTAPFMQEMGISSKNVPGAMAMAQAVQAVATLVALGTVYQSIGPKWTLALGAASWFMLYVVYMIGRPAALIVVSQGFHGLAYVLFIMGGWTYVAQVAPTAIGGSAQALISLVTMGIGLFFGTQAAGFFMERAKVNDKFQWGRVWSVPLIVTLVGTLALAGVFHAPPVKKADEKPAEKAAAVAVEQGPQT